MGSGPMDFIKKNVYSRFLDTLKVNGIYKLNLTIFFFILAVFLKKCEMYKR